MPEVTDTQRFVSLALLSSWELAFSMYVPGKPEPGGSKRAFIVKSGGFDRAIVTDANKNVGAWKDRVSLFALEKLKKLGLEKPLVPEGPVRVWFGFVVPRPKGHFRTGKNADQLSAHAPIAPTSKPDCLKLARAIEDALTGIAYRDDAQIVYETIHKAYGDAPGEAAVEVWRYKGAASGEASERLAASRVQGAGQPFDSAARPSSTSLVASSP